MSDDKALLAAIRDNPDDIHLRLVYADWLDEHAITDAQRGRAEFIRVECEVHDLYAVRNQEAKRYRKLERRANELRKKFAAEWLKGFPEAKYDSNSFVRGFLVRVKVDAAKCVKSPRPPWEREPLVDVELTGTAKNVRKLCDKGWLDGVTELDLHSSSPDDATGVVEAVAASGCAAPLRRLMLWGESYGDPALEAVAGGAFRHLRELSCMGQFTTAGWEAVLNSPAVSNLDKLTIGHRGPWQTANENRPGPELADVLADAKVHSQLTFLWLCACGLANDGITRLATGCRFKHLQYLHIDTDGPGSASLKALGAAKLPALTNLRLSQCELRDAALKALARSPLMGQLEQLELSLNQLTATSARAIAGSRQCSKLKHLDLGCNNIGDEGAAALARSRNFPALEVMHLSSTEIGNAGADAIAKAPWAKQLNTLFLSYNAISERKQAQLKKQFGPVLWIDGSVSDD